MRRTGFAAILIAVLALTLPIVPAAASNGGPDPTVSWASAAPGVPSHAHGRPSILRIHPQAFARAKEHANAHAVPGGLRHQGDGTVESAAFNGQQDARVTPPDTTGAIGPSRYVELVNRRYGIYDRAGSVIAQGPLSDLTGISSSCLSDPNVIWDADGSRFYYSVLDVCGNTFAFGFSRNPAPTNGAGADWCRYTAFQYGSSLPDFPKLGDSGDFLMIGANIFQPLYLSYIYLRSDVDWISKADLRLQADGSCPSPAGIHAGTFLGVKNADGTDASTPVPANGVEFGSPTGYVVAGPDASSSPGGVASSLTLFRVTANGIGGATLSPPATVPVASYSVPANAPQGGTKRRLDTSDARFTQAVAAFDPSVGQVGVWTQHTVFGGPGAEVRWYEISGDGGVVLHSGKATASGLFAFNGAISPDRAVAGPTQSAFGGSMAMTFDTSSRTAFTAIQLVTQPVGGIQSPFVKIVQSPGKNLDFSCSQVCRWGDYAGASPDPAGKGTAGTVWLANQWNATSLTANDVDWRTSVFSVTP